MKINPLIAAVLSIILLLTLVVMLRNEFGAPEVPHESQETEEKTETGSLNEESILETAPETTH